MLARLHRVRVWLALREGSSTLSSGMRTALDQGVYNRYVDCLRFIEAVRSWAA